MKNETASRRAFLHTAALTGAAAAFTARSYARVIGANDRIHVGMIGSGGRGGWHIGWIQRCSEELNADVNALCDIWSTRLEQGVNETVRRFEHNPKRYRDYHQMLTDPDVDAVVISTPDHQHCRQLIHAVEAGKDVYLEKPCAMTLDELNEAYDVVTASDRIVQHGTQGRSSGGAHATKEFIESGELGKILRIEQCRSHYIPYWNHYSLPQSEDETDWSAFLYNRPNRPFDPDQHGCWMGYRDFSSGTIGGWMSHFSDFVHFITGAQFPDNATAQGGVYSPTSDPRRDCPDTVTALLEYPEGFTTLYTTHFGNAANDYMLIFGTKGTMRVNDPDGNNGGIAPRVSGEGSDHPEKIAEALTLDNTADEDHMANWLRCVRSRETPNADMDAGYRHGIACILADRAYEERRMMRFDPATREIVVA